jgi:hypothetical protein
MDQGAISTFKAYYLTMTLNGIAGLFKCPCMLRDFWKSYGALERKLQRFSGVG